MRVPTIAPITYALCCHLPTPTAYGEAMSDSNDKTWFTPSVVVMLLIGVATFVWSLWWAGPIGGFMFMVIESLIGVVLANWGKLPTFSHQDFDDAARGATGNVKAWFIRNSDIWIMLVAAALGLFGFGVAKSWNDDTPNFFRTIGTLGNHGTSLMVSIVLGMTAVIVGTIVQRFVDSSEKWAPRVVTVGAWTIAIASIPGILAVFGLMLLIGLGFFVLFKMFNP